jgi:hypothetical protein
MIANMKKMYGIVPQGNAAIEAKRYAAGHHLRLFLDGTRANAPKIGVNTVAGLQPTSPP